MTGMRKLVLALAAAVVLPAAALSGPAGFDGAWQAIDPPSLLRPAAGGAPPLLPAAQAIYQRNIADRARHQLSFDGFSKCLPPGIPRLLLLATPFRVVAGTSTVGMFFQWNHAIRLIHLGIPHYDPIGPAYLGQSVGRWQGGTLLVDTTDFNDTTLLDDALPHSTQLHVIERLRLVADDLDDQLTIDDPATFAHSWSFDLRFRRLPDATALVEDYCLRRSGMLGAK